MKLSEQDAEAVRVNRALEKENEKLREDVREVNGNDTREETKEIFDRRASEEVFAIGQKGSLTYAYRPYLGTPSQNTQAAKEGLTRIGVPVIVFEQLECNKDEVTTTYQNDATTIPGVAVFIHKDATVDALEIVAHEGYHYLAVSISRIAYEAVLTANVDFASKAFILQ